MSTIKMRYGVVCKAPNCAKYGAGARPEYYLHTWTEKVQEDTDQWGPDDWIRFQADQDQEATSCEAELASYV